MQQTDDVVLGWLNGSDSFDGMDNPAGPLYIEGAAATEAALTNPEAGSTLLTSVGGSCSTCSLHMGGGCFCC